MKIKPIIQVVLGLAIVGLGFWLYTSIMKPVRFDNEFNKRRDACALKLKTIRSLEEVYKTTYGCYMGSFDTLVNRLLTEDSLLITQKVYHPEKYPNSEDFDINDISETEALRKGYMTLIQTYVNPINQLREQGKLFYKDEDGVKHDVTDEEIRNIDKVPYPKDGDLRFHLEAGFIESSGFQVPVFECKVDFEDLLADLNHQEVINKISEIKRINRYPGWKVGDMTQSITDGNFE